MAEQNYSKTAIIAKLTAKRDAAETEANRLDEQVENAEETLKTLYEAINPRQEIRKDDMPYFLNQAKDRAKDKRRNVEWADNRIETLSLVEGDVLTLTMGEAQELITTTL